MDITRARLSLKVNFGALATPVALIVELFLLALHTRRLQPHMQLDALARVSALLRASRSLLAAPVRVRTKNTNTAPSAKASNMMACRQDYGYARQAQSFS